jgi:uncharacterized membrane-anchored protein YjiN (DUF445 family)
MTDPELHKSGPSLKTMRLIAGAMLVAMAGLYFLAVFNYGVGPWGYARAFAEAALVGGLADWFAVTALFRHPLGLPIPHTAIIPRNKDRIASSLGQFVSINFLAPEIVEERVKHEDLAHGIARQVAEPVTAERIAEAVADALPSLLELLDDAAVGQFMRKQIDAFTQNERVSAALGKALEFLTEQGRHAILVDAALREGWRALEEHEGAIRSQIRANTGWMWRMISLDARAADSLIAALEETLRDVARDSDHPIRQRVTQIITKFAQDLQHDPEMRARIETSIADLMANPAVTTYMEDLWRSAKKSLHQTITAPGSEVRNAVRDGVLHFAASLLDDEEAREALNVRLRALLVEGARRHGADAGNLITETIRSWDAATVVEKLEQNVGPDLQYIRINGTVIGGLIGLCIHQMTLWLM